jgi:transposase
MICTRSILISTSTLFAYLWQLPLPNKAPPYSPELNRIEKLWHKIKYEWLAFKARDAQTLEADVDTILQEFGLNYRFTFC